MTRPPALPSRFPSRAAARAGRARMQGEAAPSSAGNSRGSSAASSSRPDSALRDYAQTAITRAIYRHAREYLPGIAEANPAYSPFWRVLCAVRKGARAVVLESSVIRALSDAVDEKRQLLAKRADDMWQTLLSQVDCIFSCDAGADDVTAAAKLVAAALAEMLAGFEGGDVVQKKFEGMADTFRESEASLRNLADLLGVDLGGFQEMRGTIEQCALEAARILSLFEDHVSELRLQLNQALQSPKRQLAAGRPFSGSGDNLVSQVAISTSNPHADDHISALLQKLQRDLCDKPMNGMVAIAEAVAQKIAHVTSRQLPATYAAGSIDYCPKDAKRDMLSDAPMPSDGTAMTDAREGSGPEAPASHGPAKIVLDLAKQIQLQAVKTPVSASAGYPAIIPAELACATLVTSPASVKNLVHDTQTPAFCSPDEPDDHRFEMTVNPSSHSMLAEFEAAQVIMKAGSSCMVPARADENGDEDNERVRQDTPKGLSASLHSTISCPSNVIGIHASSAASLKTEECKHEHISLEASISMQDADPPALLEVADSLASLSESAALQRHHDERISAANEADAADCAPIPNSAMKPAAQRHLSRNHDANNSQSGVRRVNEQHRNHNLSVLQEHGPRRPEHYMNYMGPKAAALRKSRNRLQVPPPLPDYVQESSSRAMLSQRLAPLIEDSSAREPMVGATADLSISGGIFEGRQHPHMDQEGRLSKTLSSQSTGKLLTDADLSISKTLSASALRVARSQANEHSPFVEMDGSCEHGMVHSRSDTWLDVRSVDCGAMACQPKRRMRGTRSSACPATPKLPSLPCLSASPVKISGSSITVAKGSTKSSPMRTKGLLGGSWGAWETPAATRPVFDRGHVRRRSRGVSGDLSVLGCSASDFLR